MLSKSYNDMCSTSPSPNSNAMVNTLTTIAPYGFKLGMPFPPHLPAVGAPPNHMTAAEYHRFQLYNSPLRYAPYSLAPQPLLPPYVANDFPHAAAYMGFHARHDLRSRLVHEEPKPNYSYIGLIAMAILSSKDHKLVLSDIYQWILESYAYFRTRGPGWRNSIRHNLSLNDCFIKSGRSANGKGHYWAVHPANVEDFKKGDFRRRQAQRKVRRHLGLEVLDETPPSSPTSDIAHENSPEKRLVVSTCTGRPDYGEAKKHEIVSKEKGYFNADGPPTKKRHFDVESLLAPESPKIMAESAAAEENRPTSSDSSIQVSCEFPSNDSAT